MKTTSKLTVSALMALSLASPALALQPGGALPQPKPEAVNIPEGEKPQWMKDAEEKLKKQMAERAAKELAANPKLEPKPLVAATITSADADIKAASALLTGSFCAAAQGDQPALSLNTAVVAVTGLDNAVYFELSRTDSPQSPFRQGVLHLYKFKGELRLRMFDFAKVNSTWGNMLAGLYAAPEALPQMKLEMLVPVADLTLTSAGGSYMGKSAGYPTNTSGALEATSTWTIAPDALTIADRGYDASGTQVWGPKTSEGLRFAKCASPIKVNRLDKGVVTLDFVAGSGDSAVDGYEIFLQYTGMLHSDGLQFDTSRTPNRQPLQFVLPGQLIPGFNAGVVGLQKGSLRKIVMPGDQGYGERGNPRARIPGNAALVFEVECVQLRKAEPAPTPPPSMPAPAGAQPGAAAPTNALPAGAQPVEIAEKDKPDWMKKAEKEMAEKAAKKAEAAKKAAEEAGKPAPKQ